MRNQLARQILHETPAEVRQFVHHYGELLKSAQETMQEKEWPKKDLARKMDGDPSEISKELQ